MQFFSRKHCISKNLPKMWLFCPIIIKTNKQGHWNYPVYTSVLLSTKWDLSSNISWSKCSLIFLYSSTRSHKYHKIFLCSGFKGNLWQSVISFISNKCLHFSKLQYIHCAKGIWCLCLSGRKRLRSKALFIFPAEY